MEMSSACMLTSTNSLVVVGEILGPVSLYYKDSISGYGDSHVKDKTVDRLTLNCTVKTTSLYRDHLLFPWDCLCAVLYHHKEIETKWLFYVFVHLLFSLQCLWWWYILQYYLPRGMINITIRLINCPPNTFTKLPLATTWILIWTWKIFLCHKC